jgi:hypothetical protein
LHAEPSFLFHLYLFEKRSRPIDRKVRHFFQS